MSKRKETNARGTNMNGYVLGLVSVSFRKSTPEEIIKAAVEAGLECIEWGSDIHAPAGEREKLEAIAALQKEHGLYCSSYGTYFRLGVTPLSELEGYIAAAKILGTDVLRVWCGDKSGASMTAEERTAFTDECKRAARIAERQGVVLCTECHGGTFTERPEDTVYLMEEVGSGAFRTYWQPFQWLGYEGSLAVARAVSPYCEHIHVFNWRGKDKLPLAEASDEWKEYLSAFSRPRTLLLEFMPDGKTDSLKREAEALARIVEGL